MQHRGLRLVLCDDPEGWDAMGGGREAHEGGDICILMADSHSYMVESNTTV